MSPTTTGPAPTRTAGLPRLRTADAVGIAGWSATCALGHGADARARLAALHPGTARPESPPGAVPDFEAREVLGSRGTRSMDRLGALAVATARDVAPEDGTRAGLVLATTTGSAESTAVFSRDSLTAERPHLVDPGRFPATVMNCAAGLCAIWWGLRGPNVTLAAGRVGGVAALRYATRLLRAGRADSVVVGGVEEWTETATRLHAATDPGSSLPGEGAAFVRLEDGLGGAARGRGSFTVVATGLATAPTAREAPGATLAALVRRTFERHAPGVAPVRVVPGAAGRDAEVEVDAVGCGLPPGAVPEVVAPATWLGDTGAATVPLHLAVALAGEPTGPVLLTAVDPAGGAGCVLIAPTPS